jgi:hypothetical protein
MAAVFAIRHEGDENLRWDQIAAPEIRTNIYALALMPKWIITVATEVGIVVFDQPSDPCAAQ